MIYLKTDEEIELVRAANMVVARTLGEVAKHIEPGVTTLKLNQVAEDFIRYPYTLCVSVNENVVHAFPSNYALREGDIVSVDCGAVINGFNGDSCYTFPVGEVSDDVMRLLKTTKESLYVGISKAVAGNRIGDIGHAIQEYCEKRGFSVVRELCGHGIGRDMHEDPDVPNYGRRGTGPLIKNGMCIAIEPMINLGSKNIVMEADGWTCRTKDRKPSAHYEHTVAIKDGKADILSSFQFVEEVLGDKSI